MALVLVGIFAISANAAEVLEVGKNARQLAISQSKDTRSFAPRDYLCVWHSDEPVACGTVIEVLPKGAVLRLDYAKEPIRKGDKVYFAGTRHPAFATTEEEKVIEAEEAPKPWKRKYPFDLTAGMVLTSNYTFPLVLFQGLVSPHWTVGLGAQYVSQAPSNVKGYGGMLTANYYGSRYFRGVWLQMGAGLFFLSPYSGGSTVSVASGLATVGVRLKIVGKLNLGLGVGGQYISQSSTATARVPGSSLQALGTADLGFNF